MVRPHARRAWTSHASAALRRGERQISASNLGSRVLGDRRRAKEARSEIGDHVHFRARVTRSQLHVSVVRPHVWHEQFSRFLLYVPRVDLGRPAAGNWRSRRHGAFVGFRFVCLLLLFWFLFVVVCVLVVVFFFV